MIAIAGVVVLVALAAIVLAHVHRQVRTAISMALALVGAPFGVIGERLTGGRTALAAYFHATVSRVAQGKAMAPRVVGTALCLVLTVILAGAEYGLAVATLIALGWGPLAKVLAVGLLACALGCGTALFDFFMGREFFPWDRLARPVRIVLAAFLGVLLVGLGYFEYRMGVWRSSQTVTLATAGSPDRLTVGTQGVVAAWLPVIFTCVSFVAGWALVQAANLVWLVAVSATTAVTVVGDTLWRALVMAPLGMALRLAEGLVDLVAGLGCSLWNFACRFGFARTHLHMEPLGIAAPPASPPAPGPEAQVEPAQTEPDQVADARPAPAAQAATWRAPGGRRTQAARAGRPGPNWRGP